MGLPAEAGLSQTASLPVIVYAEDLHADREKLYRALLISNLITIHAKAGIGRLSAYCGAVSAGAGDGLVVKGVENSIANFGRLARIGMRETDEEIIRMMTEDSGRIFS